MPVVAYQSMNATSSKDHGLRSIQFKRFTRETNERVVGDSHQALVLPVDTSNIDTPILGPANRVPIATLEAEHHGSREVFASQIALINQHAVREVGLIPDIVVVGELDIEHPDMNGMVSGQAMSAQSHAATKACQCFTSFKQSTQNKYLSQGTGWVAYEVSNLVVVFVHVPNAIAHSKDGTYDFYTQMAHSLNIVGGRIIDVVIGDTNQSSFNYTAEALSIALEPDYENAVTREVSPVDNWMVTQSGTNSTATKMYDIAVVNKATVDLLGYAYLSQSSTGTTVTDHCGLVLRIERK